MNFSRLQRFTVFHFLALMLSLPFMAAAQSSPDVGELFASETTAHGPALLAGTGMTVASGSQLSAGKSIATLRLGRGGEVRVCPNTSVTVSAVQANAQQKEQELMLSMDSGSVEINYPINDLADTVLTPEFKLMLAGPGIFHLAFGVNSHGDTCIRPLGGNSASVIVTEMLGNGAYQVKPDEAVMFVDGKLSGRSTLDTDCGCPKPAPVMEAKQTGQPENDQRKSAEASPGVGLPAGTASNPAAPSPPTRPGNVHVQVDVPLVFRGDQPEPAFAIAKISFAQLPNASSPLERLKPPVLKPGKTQIASKDTEKKGFFGRIKGFFGSLFR